jgi:hypothetical protein
MFNKIKKQKLEENNNFTESKKETIREIDEMTRKFLEVAEKAKKNIEKNTERAEEEIRKRNTI